MAIIRVKGLSETAAGFSLMGEGGVRRATRRALSMLAQGFSEEMTDDLDTTFDRPTPFTKRAFNYDRARGNEMRSRTYVRPKQSDYLLIQETGGERIRGEKGPKGGRALPLQIKDDSIGDQYGNLGPLGIAKRVHHQSLTGRKGRKPKEGVKKRAARRRVFVGKVGKTYGLWSTERVAGARKSRETKVGPQQRDAAGRFIAKKRRKNATKPAQYRMRLLVAFQNDAHYDERLEFGVKALAYANRNMVRAMENEIFAEYRRGQILKANRRDAAAARREALSG